jgi:hypothetical protein
VKKIRPSHYCLLTLVGLIIQWTAAVPICSGGDPNSAAQKPPLSVQDLAGKRIMVLGDSITQDGRYVSFVAYYLNKRYADQAFDIASFARMIGCRMSVILAAGFSNGPRSTTPRRRPRNYRRKSTIYAASGSEFSRLFPQDRCFTKPGDWVKWTGVLRHTS